MRLISLLYKNIARRRIGSALTGTGMAVVVAALVGIADEFKRSFLDMYQLHNANVVASAMAWSIWSVAIVIGAVGMLNTMIVSVFKCTSEFGILRAIGWRRGRIMRMIILEAGLLCVAGGVVGTLLALGMTQLLSHAPTTAGLVSGYVAPGVIVHALCIAVLIGILGTIYPAIRAARLLPTVVLRGQG